LILFPRHTTVTKQMLVIKVIFYRELHKWKWGGAKPPPKNIFHLILNKNYPRKVNLKSKNNIL